MLLTILLNCYASLASAPPAVAVLFVLIYLACVGCIVRFGQTLSRRSCCHCAEDDGGTYIDRYRAHVIRLLVVTGLLTAAVLCGFGGHAALHALKVLSLGWATYILADMMQDDARADSDIRGTNDPSYWLALSLGLCTVLLSLMPQLLVAALQIPVYAYQAPVVWP